MHEHNRPKKPQLKMEPAYDEHSQFERLIKSLERIEEGLDAIHQLLESVMVSDGEGKHYLATREQ